MEIIEKHFVENGYDDDLTIIADLTPQELMEICPPEYLKEKVGVVRKLLVRVNELHKLLL